MNKRRTGRQRRKQEVASTRLWPTLLFLLVVVGGVFFGKVYMTAPGGALNAQGLRVSGEGRSDASQVMDPASFQNPRIHGAYVIAQRIPETLNQLYCWCGCIERIGHRSALECFESSHGAFCDVCIGTAEIAWEMTERGITDPGEIQKAVDARYGRGPRL